MKKIIQNTILLAVVITCLISCRSRANEEVVVENKFKVNIPTYLSQTFDLNEDATLQYQSRFRDVYVMVIEDTKEEFHNILIESEITDEYSSDFEGFAKLMFACGGFWDVPEDDVKINKINGLNAITVETSNIIEGVDIFYKAALIEGKTTYYQIVAWTNANKKSKNKADIEKMVDSFTEL